MDILKRIELTGLVPVVKIQNSLWAEKLADALQAGGLSCAEVTFRTGQAADALRAMRRYAPGMLLGAGTVTDLWQVDQALQAGADFIVSAGLNPEVVRYCQKKKACIIPGCVTPSEIETALSLGLSVVKFFPAQASGGVAMMKALSGPYGNLRFLPTGGIGQEQLGEYLDFNRTLACGGSWMVKETLLETERWDEITRLSREAVETMLDFHIKKILIPAGDDRQMEKKARELPAALVQMGRGLWEWSQSKDSVCQVVLGTRQVERAVYYLKQAGVECVEGSIRRRADGRIWQALLRQQVGECTICLEKT